MQFYAISSFLRGLLLGAGLFFFQSALATPFPTPGDTLNFREVFFQWDPIWQADSYRLRIWASPPGAKSPSGSPSYVLQQSTPFNSLILSEWLEFGNSYTWEVTAFFRDSLLYTSETHNFHLRTAPRMDPAIFRHRVVMDLLPEGHPGYFFIDKPGVMIDRKGAVIWFLPADSVSRVFNLQLLPNGHIAYLRPAGKGEGNEDLVLEEITLTGDLVWRAPDDGQVSGHEHEYYHHDFQRLSNGHYMVLGNRYVARQPEGAKGPISARYGTLIEYDTAGKAIWSWRSEDYLLDEDVFEAGLKDNPTHLNGFFFDETTGYVYVSFRYIDRVVQLDYATRQVVNSFGRKMPSGEARSGDSLFLRQHSPKVRDNRLYLYDNRLGKGADTVSSVVVLEIPKDAHSPIQLLDRYALNFGSRRESWSESKGDVDLLPGEQVLACMGSLPRTVVWDASQGLVWQVEHETRPDTETPWRGIEANYRADWAPTLYPLRFSMTAGSGGGVGKAKDRAAKIQIDNLGSLSDTYEIGVLGAKGKYRILRETGAIFPKHRWHAELLLKKSWQRSATGWELSVRSRQFPDQQMRLFVPLP